MIKLKSCFMFIILAFLSLTEFAHAGWKPLPGSATDIGIGGGRVWATGTNNVYGGFGIWQWRHNTWQMISGGATEITVDSQGKPWVVNDQGEIYAFNGSWHRLPGAARDIAAGGMNSVWVIGTDRAMGGYGIYHWNGGNWDRVEGAGVRIAVDTSGNPWVVNDRGKIYRYAYGHWQQIHGRATDIAIGRDNSVWIIGKDHAPSGYGIYHFNGNGWDRVEGSAVRIAVDGNGLPWVVNRDGNIYMYEHGRNHHGRKGIRFGHGININFNM